MFTLRTRHNGETIISRSYRRAKRSSRITGPRYNITSNLSTREEGVMIASVGSGIQIAKRPIGNDKFTESKRRAIHQDLNMEIGPKARKTPQLLKDNSIGKVKVPRIEKMCTEGCLFIPFVRRDLDGSRKKMR
jgi:hypothetical protein